MADYVSSVQQQGVQTVCAEHLFLCERSAHLDHQLGVNGAPSKLLGFIGMCQGQQWTIFTNTPS
mgnify:CR=1 FL=1